MKNGLIRAFIALRFDERSVSHLVSARERLLDNAAEGRAVPDRDMGHDAWRFSAILTAAAPKSFTGS